MLKRWKQDHPLSRPSPPSNNGHSNFFFKDCSKALSTYNGKKTVNTSTRHSYPEILVFVGIKMFPSKCRCQVIKQEKLKKTSATNLRFVFWFNFTLFVIMLTVRILFFAWRLILIIQLSCNVQVLTCFN